MIVNFSNVKSNLNSISSPLMQNKTTKQAKFDTVNFGSNDFTLNFIDKDTDKNVELYPGEIKKMEKGRWILLPTCGATFRLANCKKLDTKSKDFQARLKNLKNNEGFTIGRNDFNDENIKVSRKHLQFIRFNNEIYVRDISLNGTTINVDGIFKNYDFKYLQEKYGKNPYFRELINEKYSSLRRCGYSANSTYVAGLEPIQTAIDGDVKFGHKKITKDWVYRQFDRMPYKNGKVSQRISLNVVAHAYLIEELDSFFATGLYRDGNGQWQCLKNFDSVCAYYKTPARAAGWSKRHDPITIYSQNKITDEFYKAIVEITRKYRRKPENNVPLQGVCSKNYWISIEDEPNSDIIIPIIEEAENINRNLGLAVYEECYKNGKTPLISTGKLNACRIIIDEYEEFLKQDKKRFATISLNNLLKYFNK